MKWHMIKRFLEIILLFSITGFTWDTSHWNNYIYTKYQSFAWLTKLVLVFIFKFFLLKCIPCLDMVLPGLISNGASRTDTGLGLSNSSKPLSISATFLVIEEWAEDDDDGEENRGWSSSDISYRGGKIVRHSKWHLTVMELFHKWKRHEFNKVCKETKKTYHHIFLLQFNITYPVILVSNEILMKRKFW